MTRVISMSAGLNFSLALDKNGNLWSWGRNGDGQLGLGDIGDNLTPSQVRATNLGRIVDIAAGERHAVIVDFEGHVWTWGHNGYGQLGDGTMTSLSVPVLIELDNVVAVAVGRLHSLALKKDGSVWAWGNNDEENKDQLKPVQVYRLGDVKAIAAGGMHSVALKNDGTLWAWGYNKYGRLVAGGKVDSNYPIRSHVNVIAISAGYLHTVFLTTEYNVFAAGRNTVGQLGNNSTQDSLGVVLSITDGVQISAGAYHTLAVDNRGFAWSWGQNSSGQVGDGTLATRVKRFRLPAPPLP